MVKVNGRIAILDLLRFLAAFWVMLYHYQPFISKHIDSEIDEIFKFGYLGVNFFFMLSGFVIMASAQNRTAFKFATLRAIRLYPAFIVCLLITIFVLYYFDYPLPSFFQALLNGLIINDYFGVANIDGVYWTLQAELKFYGCMFLLILFSIISSYRVWITIWIFLASIFYFIQQPFFLGWFISPSYSFCFIGGIAAYYLYLKPEDVFSLLVMFASMIFAALSSWRQVDGFYISPTDIERYIASIVTVVFFVFFLLLRKIDNCFFYAGWLSILGGISYPLYLLHSRAGKILLDFFSKDMLWWAALLTTTIIVLATSLGVHLLIEKPVFRLVRKRI